MKQLPSLFDPVFVSSMAEEDINRLSAESEGHSNERKRCSERLAVLEAGLSDLQPLNRHRPIMVGKLKTDLHWLLIMALTFFPQRYQLKQAQNRKRKIPSPSLSPLAPHPPAKTSVTQPSSIIDDRNVEVSKQQDVSTKDSYDGWGWATSVNRKRKACRKVT